MSYALRIQAAVAVVLGAALLLISGRHATAGVLAVSGTGLVLCATLFVRYFLRVATARRSRSDDATAGLVLLAQLGLIAACVVVIGRSYNGITPSRITALVGVLLLALPLTFVVATAVHGYFVLPGLAGRDGGRPVWESDPFGRERGRRRELTGIWLLQQGVTYVIVRLDLVVLAVAIVARVSDIPSRASLGPVVGAFGVLLAWSVMGGPRTPLAAAYESIINPSVALGDWIEGTDATGQRVSGLVVDVAITAGIGIVDIAGRRTHIPLDAARRLRRGARPIDDAWAAHAFAQSGLVAIEDPPADPDRGSVAVRRNRDAYGLDCNHPL